MKKKYAFLLMGSQYDILKHKAEFETESQISYIFTVKNLEEAIQCAVNCLHNGVGAIELCGAFGKDGAEEIIKATQNKIAVGYVVHNSEQDILFDKFFSDF